LKENVSSYFNSDSGSSFKDELQEKSFPITKNALNETTEKYKTLKSSQRMEISKNESKKNEVSFERERSYEGKLFF